MSQERVVGVDLGGTKIALGVLDGPNILLKRKVETQAERGPDAIIADIVSIAQGMVSELGGTVGALGIGVPGQIEKGTGSVIFAPNLHWRDVPLKERLEKALNAHATVTNDVKAITYGEFKHGAGVGTSDMVCIFVGTGIGGGIVLGGELLQGSTGSAGEVGHLTIVSGGRKCTCPGSGCFEAYAGGWGIGARTREAVQAQPDLGAVIAGFAQAVNEEISAEHLSKAFHQGDAFAKKLVAETADYLAAGIVSVVNMLNPEMVVLGGGVLDGIPELLELVVRQVPEKALGSATRSLKIVPATLKGDAGIVGAGALAASNKSKL